MSVCRSSTGAGSAGVTATAAPLPAKADVPANAIAARMRTVRLRDTVYLLWAPLKVTQYSGSVIALLPSCAGYRKQLGHAVLPLLRAELGLHEVPCGSQLGRTETSLDGTVAVLEGLHHDPDDFLAGAPGLPPQRIHPLPGAGNALVGDFLLADPQHVHHLVRVDVIGHRH